MKNASVAVVITALVALAGCGSSSADGGGSEPAPLTASSSCEDQYWHATNSPSAQEDGTDGFVPKDEWIANCKGEPSPISATDDGSGDGLGSPVESVAPPAVVPDTATLTDGCDGCYELPSGTTTSQVDAWYAANMMPGEDFASLTWLDQDQMSDFKYWFWCTADGEILTVGVMEGDESTNNAAFISTTIDEDLDAECP